MTDTYNFKLPLLAASQAQKHVTVNEALLRLDALANIRVQGILSVAPTDAVDGECFIVATGAVGDWAVHVNDLAIRQNGGWMFATPQAGWSGREIASGKPVGFNGQNWILDAVAFSTGGASSKQRIIEFDHVIDGGTNSITLVPIPSQTLVQAISVRVIAPVTGAALNNFSIGVAADLTRYGSGIGADLNAYSLGLTGSPVAYYVETPIVLTPDIGGFSGGSVRLAIHLSEVEPPRAI